jgi:hypothetical protein
MAFVQIMRKPFILSNKVQFLMPWKDMMPKKNTSKFQIKKCFRQGDTLSPQIFIAALEEIIKRVNTDTPLKNQWTNTEQPKICR